MACGTFGGWNRCVLGLSGCEYLFAEEVDGGEDDADREDDDVRGRGSHDWKSQAGNRGEDGEKRRGERKILRWREARGGA